MTPLVTDRAPTDTNPMAHIVMHLRFAPREAVLQEIVRVWSEHQEMVRFETFQRRLLGLRDSTTDSQFWARACDLVLWFGKEQPYLMSEPHTVDAGVLESYLLHAASSFIWTLSNPGQQWRVNPQADKERLQISDPNLGWLGRNVPWEKAQSVAQKIEQDPQFKKWTAAVYLRVNGQPWRVQWINTDTGMMSCNLNDIYQVKLLNEWMSGWR